MNVIVSSGFAICGGCLKFEETNRTLSITASDSNYDRIDTVVMRLNDNDAVRACDLYIVAGTPASSPVRPELNRQSSVWEIGLADLFIAKNTSTITNARITDTRLETARCGVISSVSQWDTTTLYEQIQDDLAGFKSGEEAEFLAWFEEMKGQLSEDAAGNLQTEIGTLASLTTTDKSSIVAAINWLHANMSTTAEDTSYDNAASGLAATNVQDAVDELNDSLDNGNISFYSINGEPYVKVGADAGRPFNLFPKPYDLLNIFFSIRDLRVGHPDNGYPRFTTSNNPINLSNYTQVNFKNIWNNYSNCSLVIAFTDEPLTSSDEVNENANFIQSISKSCSTQVGYTFDISDICGNKYISIYTNIPSYYVGIGNIIFS